MGLLQNIAIMVLLIVGGIILIATVTGFNDWSGLNALMPGLGDLIESTLSPFIEFFTALIAEIFDFFETLLS